MKDGHKSTTITLPAFVDHVVQDYITRLNAVSAGNITGVYLTGSVSLGDYYRHKSDIDFITITQTDLSKDLLRQLNKIHRNIENKYTHPRLNGYYLTIPGIINNNRSFPSFFRRRMYGQRPIELLFSLFELKFFSYRIYGLPVDELPISVELEDVMKEQHENINSYWATWVHKYSRTGFNRLLLILFPRLTEWGVLGVARQLYTLYTGAVASKLQAGRYWQQKLPEEFKSIMTTAVEARRLNKTVLRPSLKRASSTLKCMGWIIKEFNATYNRRYPPATHYPPVHKN